jgi:N-sulfoglucosamine sulfohydrolase
MRDGLKKQQTMLHDCGFLPEGTLVQRAKQHQTTIFELIRNPRLYDQQGYMRAADVANFAKPADLPKLAELLGSSDEGYAYWGVVGCIQLGKQAATPEILKTMEKLLKADVKDERTLDVRVTAALYLCQIDQKKHEALGSLAEVITTAEGKAAGKGRAWANIFLLGAEAKGIKDMLKGVKLSKKDQETLSIFQARLE